MAALWLTGCSDKLMGALLVPAGSIDLMLPLNIEQTTVFTCFGTALSTLGHNDADWDRAPIVQPSPLVLQTGGYEANLGGGYKARISLEGRDTSSPKVTVKAIGPYFHDFGSEPAARQLGELIRMCVNGEPQPTLGSPFWNVAPIKG